MFARDSPYTHQKVVLEIDFSGFLFGYTEITLVPTSRDLKTIYLHLRQCHVTSVQVGGVPVQDWVHNDPLTNFASSDVTDCHKHRELKRKLYSAYAECDEGELGIPLPRQVSIQNSDTLVTAQSIRPGANTPEPGAQDQTSAQLSTAREFKPIPVRITYVLRNPVDGIQFIKPSDAFPHRVPHVYTTQSSPDAARCWVPCIDNLWEKCTWELEFIVPKTLEDDATPMDVDGEDATLDGGSVPTVVVCSGELVEKIAHPNNAHKVIYLFSQTSLTSAQHIAFAAGPFVVQAISAENAGISEDAAGSHSLMHAFCLPGYETLLTETTSFLRSAMNFFSTECGSYPFGSYKLVFVEELPTQRFDSATLTIASLDVLHGDDAIDAYYDSRQVLSHALACQWMGINILPKAWSDIWLVNGLGLYVTGLFLRKLLGNNEYRFRLRRDMDRVLERDIGTMPPMCQPSGIEPPDAATLAFVNLKAPLVLHILDRHLGKSGTSLGLSRVLPKIFLSALSGEMPQNALSTHFFLRTCRKVSGVDLRIFVNQWIYGSGCPQFSFSALFNRKRMAVELQMRQECPAFALNQNDPVKLALLKPVPFFEGQMTVRIHEADGTPYEHVLVISAPVKRFEVPFNTKYKRVRRNTKRYLARQAAAQAAAEGDTDAAEAIGMIDMGFGLEVWENEDERERWKVADWTEEDEHAMAGATYEWIRMDADFEWLSRIQFEQQDYMWVSQLQRDRDVVAQLEAVRALARTPTQIVSSTLTKTVLVTNYFYRIRCEAALALVTCATRRLDFLGLFHLFKLFLRYCYDSEDHEQDIFQRKYIPRPNDFSDFSEYFVRKSIINAVSQVRFESGKTPPIIRQFLIDQLRYNDNTVNAYSDAFYISSVITALACATVSTSPPERGELTRTEPKIDQSAEDLQYLEAAIAEVERYRSMDRLIPSFHNVVTVAALEFHMVLGMASLTPNDPKVFFTCTREGNANQVRLAGFDGLFMTRWYTPKIMSYIFAVIANDPSRIVRRHVARNTFESLAILATVGEMKPTGKETELLVIEEDGSTPDNKGKDSKKGETDLMIRAIRKDKEVGKSEVLREFIAPLTLDVNADYEVRWCMLKLADLAIRGVEEPLPKVTIHLPPTPITEAPPPIPPPTLKLMPKIKPPKAIGRKGSIVIPPTPSPLAVDSSKKLRLPPSTPSTPSTAPIVKSAPKTMQPPAIIPQRPVQIVKKKEKIVPKSQAAGMEINEVKACRAALKKLVANTHALLFRQPVDPVRDKAPNYFEVIKNPMDLSTMSVKLEQGKYKDRAEFEADFRLMINNCRTYNSVGTYVHNEANAFEAAFDKQWARIVNTLEAASKSATIVRQPTEEIPVVKSTGPSVKQEKATVEKAKTVPVPSPSTLPEPAPAKPTLLKLKIGSMANSNSISAEAPKVIPKPKGQGKPKKPKQVDMPPPPYIDDGSHDLLQEVIAMEQMESRSGSPSKPRKVVELDADDELLNLAVEEVPKPVDNSTTLPEHRRGPVQPPKQEVGPPPRKEAPKPKRVTEVSGSGSRPGPSKGKEKEKSNSPGIVVPKSKPSTSTSPPVVANANTQTTPINEKKCRDILKNLSKMREYGIFARPVDTVLDGCPDYYKEIKDPMDFGTMRRRLDERYYRTMEQFAADVDLIFANCRKFNPPTTIPILCADAVEKQFKKEWSKGAEKKLTPQEKRSLIGIMNKLFDQKQFWPFFTPVDPVALGIPTYYDIIPKKNARDLGTIKTKVDGDKYDSVDAWEADMNLMIQNALTFNGEESEVGQLALQLESRFRTLAAGLQQGGLGSSSGSGSLSGPGPGPGAGQNKKRSAPGDNSKSAGSGSSMQKKVKLS